MSVTVTVQNPGAAKAGRSEKLELPTEVFDVDLNMALVHQVVVGQLAAARQGTHATKTRGQVRGGGTKPYRQKGTGRARQGSIRAPQFTGGGVVHGPQPRKYDQRTPKKMKAAALRCALSDRARGGRVFVVSALVSGEAPSTRAAAEALAKVSTARRVLVVAERSDELTWKSLRNLPAVHLLEPGQLNTYDVLVSDDVVFTRAALEAFLSSSGVPLPAAKATRTTKASAKKAAAEPDETDAEPTAVAETDAEPTAVADTDAEPSATAEEG